MSDGTIGDAAHQKAGTSEHLADQDGSVDAWDCDVNLLGSDKPHGTAAEVALMRELIAEFQRQPQAQLWIFRGQIANRDVDNWRIRPYDGASKHLAHCHFQSRSSKERQPYTGDLDQVLEATNRGDDMALTDADLQKIARANWAYEIASPALGVPAKPAGDWLKNAEQARREIAATGKALLAAITALASKDHVDETALAAELAPGVAAAVVALLPADRDDITVDELREAFHGVIRDLTSQTS